MFHLIVIKIFINPKQWQTNFVIILIYELFIWIIFLYILYAFYCSCY